MKSELIGSLFKNCGLHDISRLGHLFSLGIFEFRDMSSQDMAHLLNELVLSYWQACSSVRSIGLQPWQIHWLGSYGQLRQTALLSLGLL
jgi:hypothetical protein